MSVLVLGTPRGDMTARILPRCLCIPATLQTTALAHCDCLRLRTTPEYGERLGWPSCPPPGGLCAQ